jgi:hypothetical protein
MVYYIAQCCWITMYSTVHLYKKEYTEIHPPIFNLLYTIVKTIFFIHDV